MSIMAYNIGILGNMARGNTEYDAAAASTAANNLAVLAQLDGRGHWPEGSDNASLGMEVTAALPAIWEDMGGFGEAWMAYAAAAEGVAAVAGDGLEALQGAMGALGGACGGCHRNFRQSDN
jgi:cytochrome c556